MLGLANVNSSANESVVCFFYVLDCPRLQSLPLSLKVSYVFDNKNIFRSIVPDFFFNFHIAENLIFYFLPICVFFFFVSSKKKSEIVRSKFFGLHSIDRKFPQNSKKKRRLVCAVPNWLISQFRRLSENISALFCSWIRKKL